MSKIYGQEKILMCSPEHFGIEYAINPWMNIDIQVDNKKAKNQWQNLYKILSYELDADVRLAVPQEGLPDMVFSANAAFVYKNKAIMARFKHKERQPEEGYYAKWFLDNGYEVITLPENMSFEGAGDALFLGNTIYAGYLPRTDISSHAYISELLKIPVISLELVNQSFYHIDTCFCPLTDGYLIYYPDAFDDYGNKIIEANVTEDKRIVVTEEEASYFTCNAVNIGKTVVTNLTTQRFTKLLRDKGFNHIQTDLSEFIKAGGSAKCLTLKI